MVISLIILMLRDSEFPQNSIQDDGAMMDVYDGAFPGARGFVDEEIIGP